MGKHGIVLPSLISKILGCMKLPHHRGLLHQQLTAALGQKIRSRDFSASVRVGPGRKGAP